MRKNVLWTIGNAIGLIVFNTVYFIGGGIEQSTTSWLTYAFVHASFLLALIMPFLAWKSKEISILELPSHAISSTYFLIELITGLVFIFGKSNSIRNLLITQIIISALYIAFFLSNLLVNENTADEVEKREAELNYIKSITSRVKLLMGKVSDNMAKKTIERVYEILHASPVKSFPAVRTMEIQILNTITKLEEAVERNEIADVMELTNEIEALIKRRNESLMFRNSVNR